MVHGFRKGSVWFDLSTNSVSLVRAMYAKLAEQGVALLDAPVSGGPRGANSGKLAIWVGGDEAVFQKHKAVLDAMGDQARYIGAIGAGSVAKLVHNLSGAAVNVALAEAFTMGVKAGIEPLALWAAIRQGAGGRARLFDRMGGKFLTGQDDPPDFALRLLHKDVSLACQLGREVGVPMRLVASGAGGVERGAEPRMERARQPRRDEAAGRTVGDRAAGGRSARIKEVLERDG